MKVYVKPEVEVVEFMVEEKLTNDQYEAEDKGFSGQDGTTESPWA